MSVIINEFEVVVEEPEKPSEEELKTTESSPPLLTPHDIRNIIRHQERRMVRIWAH